MYKPYILVAEDECIIGADLCETVEEAGFEVEGPVSKISSAMLSFQKRKPDLAILDVQLGDGNVFPLAEKLMAADVKVIFHSGNYSTEEVEERFPSATALAKPCPPQTMLENVHQALRSPVSG
ncbi:response regulator [Altererythrobacter sp.]|nr:response regulator [Altererythrobacter sp.]